MESYLCTTLDSEGHELDDGEIILACDFDDAAEKAIEKFTHDGWGDGDPYGEYEEFVVIVKSMVVNSETKRFSVSMSLHQEYYFSSEEIEKEEDNEDSEKKE